MTTKALSAKKMWQRHAPFKNALLITTIGSSLLASSVNADKIWRENFNAPKIGDRGAVIDQPVSSLLGLCGESAEYIHTIQGSGATSSLVGKNKVIEGVVTSVVDSLSGFFIQEEASDSDNNARTSDAIFVYLNGQTTIPAEGNLIRAKGDVSELYNRTQLSLSEGILDCGAGPAIAATDISLPVSTTDVFEALEGMKVSVPQKLYITDTYNLARYGQFTASNGRLLIPTNIYNAGSTQAIALADKNARNKLVIDDKNNAQNPDNIPFPNAGLSYANTLRLGDSVESINGILDYSFNEYRILPTSSPTFTVANARTPSPTLNSDSEITVASFNVLNYFNGDGQGGGFPTARGADSVEEFTRQSNKVVAAIADINADVVGLMEIENDGFGAQSAISDLTAKLNAVMGANTYQYVGLPTTSLGNDTITVGMLYKPSAVALVGTTVTTDATPFDFGNRQPLVQSFTSLTSGETFTVAVNHFKSKGSCSSASGANVDQNDGQGCWNELRTQAANQLILWLNTQPTGVSTNNILVIGDLNSYGKEDPINTFTNNGYRNLLAEKIGIRAYSYAFGGEIGYLDHALASNELTAFIDKVHEWHINADEPRAFDYNLENKSATQVTSYYGNDAYRASDHDPVVVSFTFHSNEVMYGDFDNDADIDRDDVTLFSRRLRAGETFDSNYDFNKDSVVNTRDIGALMPLCTRARCATE
ncbi:ExeM/NucH family extracellular endonuclease [Colwelliaceae bacterium 6471]